mgnify:CR=1 FL=1
MTPSSHTAPAKSRHDAGEPQEDSGVGADRLSRFVRGERDLYFAAVAKLCKALGLPLFGETKGKGG